jgi:hypothetical protein
MFTNTTHSSDSIPNIKAIVLAELIRLATPIITNTSTNNSRGINKKEYLNIVKFF